MSSPLSRTTLLIWLGWIFMVFLVFALITIDKYQKAYARHAERIQTANDFESMDKMRLEGVTNWETYATVMADPKWCEEMAVTVVKQASSITVKPKFEPDDPVSCSQEASEMFMRALRGLSKEAKAERLNSSEWRSEQLAIAKAEIHKINKELKEASLSALSDLYIYWLVIPLVVGIGPLGLLMASRSRLVYSNIRKYGAVRSAIFVSSVIFILLFTFATPKVYHYIDTPGGNTDRYVCIVPIFYEFTCEGVPFLYTTLELTILAGELLGSIAIGFIVWVIASGVCRKDDAPVPDISLPVNNAASDIAPLTSQAQPPLKVSNDDEPLDKQAEDFNAIPLVKMGLMKPLPDCDKIANASGQFGECITNPIPVNGQIGTFAYLSRLRSRSGVGFMWHRLGSEETPVYPSPVDVYELVAIDASEWRKLYFGIYHCRRSVMVPSGLTLLPWSQLKDIERLMAKSGFPGHNQKVENFPFGLPAIVENSELLNQIMPDLGKTMARTAQKWINESKGKWGASFNSRG